MAQRGRPKKISAGEKVLLFMQSGMGWQTPSGIRFSYDHPYQLVPAEEVDSMISTGRFKRASAEDIKAYYSIEK